MRLLLDECIDRRLAGDLPGHSVKTVLQNLARFNIAVLVLCAPTNRLVDLRPLAPKIFLTLPSLKGGKAVSFSA